MKDSQKYSIENRQFNNKLILDEIGVFIQKHPDMRFQQILQSMRINTALLMTTNNGMDVMVCDDLFAEEPDKTLERIYTFKHEWDSTPPQPENKGKYPQAKLDLE